VSGDGAAIPHHGNAIGDPPDFIHPMADVNNAHPLVLELADVSEQLLDLRVGQRRVGSSRMSNRQFCDNAPAISTNCC